ncbi:MtrAB system histidine kinase MtrB [Microbacterium excoecariae]|uniref:MtrAB system histidine kinase MtrB n=1 Tax=Microbacterium excoecariae TaxID=2715210 RepID=UPI00140D8C6B|nr:MtrAB system histidine kinase MtrB [Microbacterium excoecariae]NHI17441.1 HAMP domain-containing histidine kinase [Microbacterium excoecariae]
MPLFRPRVRAIARIARRALRRPVVAWRQSMRFRTILLTTATTTLAILIAIVWAALAIQTDLFDARRQQVTEATNRTIEFTQESVADAAPLATDRAAVQALRNTMLDNLKTASSSTEFILGFPIPEQSTDLAPSAFTLRPDLFGPELLSDALREQVRTVPDTQWWQSIALTLEDGSEIPAIVVGQQLEMPGVGVYEVYLAYPLVDVAETLAFVQFTLWITGVALVIIVAGIMWLVMRAVTAPIVEVSATSERFAAGDLSARLAAHGEDELASLARSFNQMADSIESQIRELAELSLVQQRFVSDVSHELRTPLTTIRLAAGVLYGERGSFAPIAARSAELLHEQVSRFEELLTDLLEISRYDAGSVELEREDVGLSEIAAAVAGGMAEIARQQGTELRVRPADGDDIVEMDARRVRRVLRNLVGNAIEHGEGQPIDITVTAGRDAVAVGVRDYGLGMRPEHVERVFDRFWRADPSRQRTLGGTGLGLSIALGDATLHGGTLEVWSHLGVGTHFVLTLPRDRDAGFAVSPIAVEPPEALTVGDQLAGNGPTTETLVVHHENTREGHE